MRYPIKDFQDFDKPITVDNVQLLRSIGRKSINEFSGDEIKKVQKGNRGIESLSISNIALTPERRAEIERRAQRREMAKLERENEQLREALALAIKQTRVSKDFRHDRSQTKRIANKLKDFRF